MAPNMTPTPKKPTNWGRMSKTLSFWILVFLIPAAIVSYGGARDPQPQPLDLSEYRRYLEGGRVKAVTFQADNTLVGQFAQAERVKGRMTQRFTVRLVPGAAVEEQKLLESRGVRIAIAEPKVNFGSVFISVLPWIVLIAFWLFLFRQMQAGGTRRSPSGRARRSCSAATPPR